MTKYVNKVVDFITEVTAAKGNFNSKDYIILIGHFDYAVISNQYMRRLTPSQDDAPKTFAKMEYKLLDVDDAFYIIDKKVMEALKHERV